MMENKKCILVVEDEHRIRRVLKDYFTIKGFFVLEAEDGEEALERFYDYNTGIDVILLDLMLPKMNGISVIEEVRKNSEVPVIMLTAKGTESDQVTGFAKGADDYVVKPFSNQVLLGHVEAILKRSKVMVTSKEQVGKFLIDREKRQVLLGEETISLTGKEYEVLLYLIDNRNMSISRDMILNNVWGFSYEGDPRTVDTHIKQLRGKLPEECNYIKTVYGFGYRFEETDEKYGGKKG